MGQADWHIRKRQKQTVAEDNPTEGTHRKWSHIRLKSELPAISCNILFCFFWLFILIDSCATKRYKITTISRSRRERKSIRRSVSAASLII